MRRSCRRLRDRDYVKHREEAPGPRGQGPHRHRLPRELLPPLRGIRFHGGSRGAARSGLERTRSTGSRSCAISGAISPPPSAGRRNCARREVLDALNELLGPHIFPDKRRRLDPRTCPHLRQGPALAEARQVRRLHRLSELSGMQVTRGSSRRPAPTATAKARRRTAASPACAFWATIPETGLPVTLRDGRFGPFVQLGEGEKPKRSSLPKALSPAAVDLEMALKLLALPREVARHPVTGEPILAGIGRYGPYVQHGKTYANLGGDGRRAGDRRQPRHRSHRRQGKRRRLPARRGGSGPRTRQRPGIRQGNRRQGGPFRALRDRRQDQRDSAAHSGAGERDPRRCPGPAEGAPRGRWRKESRGARGRTAGKGAAPAKAPAKKAAVATKAATKAKATKKAPSRTAAKKRPAGKAKARQAG